MAEDRTAAQGRECDHNRALLPGTTKKPTDPVLLPGETLHIEGCLLDADHDGECIGEDGWVNDGFGI